jgi:carbon monoxide dehydrogenase subunit G
VPPRSYRLVVQGSGRTGFVKGGAAITLEPSATGTTVHVVSNAEVGGIVARVGQRLIEGVATTTMNRFFACLESKLEA